MKRYVKIFSAILTISVNRILAFRTDALMNNLAVSAAWSIFSVYSIYLLTTKIDGAYGYSSGELILLACIYNIIIGIFGLLFTASFTEFSDIIDKGRLDFFLLKPVDSQFFISLHSLEYRYFLRTMIGIFFTVFIGSHYQLSFTFENILFFIPAAFFAVLILYSCLFTLLTLLIWTPKMDNITNLFYTLRGFGRIPRGAFKEVGEVFFIVATPFVIIISTTTNILIGKSNIYEAVELIALSVVIFLISRYFWKYALKHYTSASS